jgi:hypothetical protein
MALLIGSSAIIVITLAVFWVETFELSIDVAFGLGVIISVFGLLAFLGYALRSEAKTNEGDWPPTILGE